MRTYTVSSFMTLAPHTIGAEQSIAVARARMDALGVRHLPVLSGGALRGVLTERDIALVSSLPGVDPERVTAEDAMTPEPYVVQPSTPLNEVASEMGKRRYGCAVVTSQGHVVGVFTSTDALLALSKFAGGAPSRGGAGWSLAEMIRRVSEDHAELSGVLDRVSQGCERILGGLVDEYPQLCREFRDLHGMLLQHWELEERFLVPLLHDIPGAAEPMTREHRAQKEQLSQAVKLLDEGAANPETFAQKLQLFTELVRDDLERESHHLQTIAAAETRGTPAPVRRLL